jgi:hypothetical protein
MPCSNLGQDTINPAKDFHGFSCLSTFKKLKELHTKTFSFLFCMAVKFGTGCFCPGLGAAHMETYGKK